MVLVLAAITLVGTWFFTARAPFKTSRLRSLARPFARLFVVIALVHLTVVKVFETALIQNPPWDYHVVAVSFAAIGFVAAFAVLRYGKRLCGALEYPSLARQFAVLSWFFPVLVHFLVIFVVLGPDEFEMAPNDHETAVQVMAVAGQLLRVWLIGVLLAYTVNNKAPRERAPQTS